MKGWWWSYEYIEIISVNYGVNNNYYYYMKEDHHSYIVCNFCSCEKKAWSSHIGDPDIDLWQIIVWSPQFPWG